jgi:F420-0:gamma-glutamyl ligase
MANVCSILQLIDETISEMPNKSVLAITSKVVSLCEGRVVDIAGTDRAQLIASESEKYIPASKSKLGLVFTIAHSTLTPNAGIDESNADGAYVLWPKDGQMTANAIRLHLQKRFNITEVGVVITDSACRPLRRGVSGVSLWHSGFVHVNDYVGQKDLFDRPFVMAVSDIAGGLAASAVLAMGEGSEQTPFAVISDVPFVHFVDRSPTKNEFDDMNLSIDDDIFEPFLNSVEWRDGTRGADHD